MLLFITSFPILFFENYIDCNGMEHEEVPMYLIVQFFPFLAFRSDSLDFFY